jgi:two-component system chemotaxis response regulator CheB
LTEVVPHLPADLPVPVLLVQHMPPLFTKLLAERLDARSALRVVEATSGAVLEAGTVYVAPGGLHMVARRKGTSVVVEGDDGPAENSCKPAVDVLFRSAVKVWGGRVLAVVLTGMGQDGLEGCRVQDEASSVVWGMPGAVSRAGLADAALPLQEMVASISRHLSPALSGVAR